MSNDDQELGITESKSYSPGDWYAEVVLKAGLADYAPMGGFIVTRPRGYALWEGLQDHLDGWFKETGAQNAYFPALIPESYLERESDIVEGFDPEVAWVTHGGHDELEERLAFRPTSESIITPFMSQWVRSHRDLPLRLNQWCSVIRWEATDTKPFFRTKEFLWQEGHTAHETRDEAWDETMTRLDQYQRVFEEVLAIPVMPGRKPEHDKFPGADTTTTVEALMPDGKSVQGATSHYLGQGFAEAYDLYFTDENENERVAHTTSWGLSWRALGALIMTHSDEQGSSARPRSRPNRSSSSPSGRRRTARKCSPTRKDIAEDLEDAGVRVELDDRDERNPGFKFNEWELKGVPVRFEIGPHEVEDDEITVVHRPDGENVVEDRADIAETIEDHFDVVFDKMYEAAEENLEENVREADSRADILGTIGQHGGYVKTAWCGDEDCEAEIKDQISAEIVMVPLDRDEEPCGDECSICGDEAEETAYFAKSY